MRIALVRHGESLGNKENRFLGAKSLYSLTDRGISQVQNSAKILGTLKFDQSCKYYSSPAVRAIETAEIICSKLQTYYTQEPRLIEVDLGELEDLQKGEVDAKYADIVRKFSESPSECQFPGGESFPDVQKRMLSFMYDKVDEGKDIVVFSHDVAIRTFLVYCMNMSVDMIWSLGAEELAWGIKTGFSFGDADVPYGSVSLVDYSNGEFEVKEIGMV